MLASLLLCLLPGPLDWSRPERPAPERSGRAPSGSAYLAEDTFTVNAKVRLEYHYVVGPAGMAAGDSIRIEDPLFHGMTWAKWGKITFDPSECTPQTDAQSASVGYMTAHTSTGAPVTVSRNVDATAGINDYAYTDATLDDGALQPGDELVVVYGDTAGGADCGFEMSDRAWHGVEIPAWESIGGAGLTVLDTVPTFDVRAESTVHTLLVTAPAQAAADTGVDLRVAVLDELGNPIEDWAGTLSVSAAYGGASVEVTAADAGVGRIHANLTAGEVARITVAGSDGSVGTSNPIEAYDPAAPPTDRVYWGDLHVHHGHSYTDGAGRYIDENITYARDVIGLDFAAESQKADPIEIDEDALWAERQQNCVGETADGRFVSMLGFEWMGDHIGGSNQGHHNFYFDRCDVPLGSHYDPVESPDGIGAFDSSQGPYAFADALRAATGAQTVIIPHATLYTGRMFTGASINNDLRTTAEIYSEWGFDMTPSDRDGSIPDALVSGNRMGFIAASDNHDGWMGNPFSVKNERSGLAAIVAPALDRADLFAGLQSRSTYATTGDRILVRYSADDGAAVRMGQAYVAAAPTFHFEVHGTQRITSVVLRSVVIGGSRTPETLESWTPNSLDAAGDYTYAWDGQERAVWLDVLQVADPLTGDNEEAWASPIWLSSQCHADGVLDPAGRCAPVDTDTDSGTDTDTHVDSGDSAPADSPPAQDSDTGSPPQPRCGCASGPDAASVLPLLLALGAVRRRR